MKTVGKKKKRVIVYRSAKKSPLVPLLIVGAVVAWYVFGNKTAAAPITIPSSDSDGGTLVDDGTGTGTQVIQPPPVVVPVGVNLPALDTVATSDRAALLRDASAYPAMVAAFKLMTSPEIVNSYNYFYNYFLPGKRLFRIPDPSAPGQWDTGMYDAIQLIRAKYGIF